MEQLLGGQRLGLLWAPGGLVTRRELSYLPEQTGFAPACPECNEQQKVFLQASSVTQAWAALITALGLRVSAGK